MTAFALKIIASACMLIDHIGAVFPGQTPDYLRFIGRIAFPIYAYMVAQGCKRTRDIRKYLLRLGLFAIISEVPFDLAFGPLRGYSGVNFLGHTNVFFTLFLGAAGIALYEKLRASKYPYLAFAASILAVFCAHLLDTDYGAFGAAFIFIIYAVLYVGGPDSRFSRFAVVAAGMVYFYGRNIVTYILSGLRQGVSPFDSPEWLTRSALPMLLCSLVAPVLICLYNGEMGGFGSASAYDPAAGLTPGSGRGAEPLAAPGEKHGARQLAAPSSGQGSEPGSDQRSAPSVEPDAAHKSMYRTIVKWAFYAFYPAHIAALAIVRDFILK